MTNWSDLDDRIEMQEKQLLALRSDSKSAVANLQHLSDSLSQLRAECNQLPAQVNDEQPHIVHELQSKRKALVQGQLLIILGLLQALFAALKSIPPFLYAKAKILYKEITKRG